MSFLEIWETTHSALGLSQLRKKIPEALSGIFFFLESLLIFFSCHGMNSNVRCKSDLTKWIKESELRPVPHFFVKLSIRLDFSSQNPRAVTSSTGSKGASQILNMALGHSTVFSSLPAGTPSVIPPSPSHKSKDLPLSLTVAVSLDVIYSKCTLFVGGLIGNCLCS